VYHVFDREMITCQDFKISRFQDFKRWRVRYHVFDREIREQIEDVLHVCYDLMINRKFLREHILEVCVHISKPRVRVKCSGLRVKG